ncbi:MAG: TIGR01212 family radical SAM protein [Lachnospiraceae bacterium]
MNERIYYPYSEYLKNKYGQKVYKLPVNLPITCPNRLEDKGCIFCADQGTGFEAASSSISVKQQLEETKELIRRKYHAHKYIAYFQNYTNTFMPLTHFRAYLNEAAQVDGIVEIAVSTRPDCIRQDYLEVLNEIAGRYSLIVTIELGLQTANYHTLEQIRRGHSLAEFIDACLQIRPYGFSVCAHVILNLPMDDRLDAVETAKILSALHVDTVKIHSLYIAKNTLLCEAYESGTISVCSKEEYFERLILFLEHLDPVIAVERLFSRVPEKDAVFSNWETSWWKLKDQFIEKMQAEESCQGKRFDYLNGSALRKLELQEASGCQKEMNQPV